jgi:TRAP-type C4-dicarboxylate transport system permease small subunit
MGAPAMPALRKTLDTVYLISGLIAALHLLAIGTVVLLQVLLNIIDGVARWVTGEAIGLLIPSYADFTGFFLIGATFFALPYAFRAGAHIRVTLFLQKLSGTTRMAFELWSLFVAILLGLYLSYYAWNLVAESAAFGDKSVGMVPVPIWIPQTGIAIGATLFTISAIDEYFKVLRGGRASYADTEGQVME